MSSEHNGLNDRQEAFVGYYLKNPNATNAARLAGYSGDANALGVMGHDLLRNPKVRAELERLRKARRLSPDAILDLMESRATMDVTAYTKEDGTLDVQELAAAGLGHLVKGIKPGREGLEIALVDPQAATKNLARYHRLLGADTQVDVSASLDLAAEHSQNR
ncbi:MAG: terminase small subunit [Planctomycetota bacterium]|jgi:hypothetical protein